MNIEFPAEYLDKLAMLSNDLGPFSDMLAPGYEDLWYVLMRAFAQAAHGKGSDRHSTGQPFREQPIITLQKLYGPGGVFFQAGKKIEESQRLEKDAAIKEILGAINYLAAAVIYMELYDKKEVTQKWNICLACQSQYQGAHHECPHSDYELDSYGPSC